jgi:hypothetical protein
MKYLLQLVLFGFALFGPAVANGKVHVLGDLIGEAHIAERCSMAQSAAPNHVVIDEIFPAVIYVTPGHNLGSEQLFQPIRTIAAPLAGLGSNCLAGKQESCRQFSDWVQTLANADALRFDTAKHGSSPVSLATGKLSGNLTLRPIALYTGILRDRGLIRFDDDRVVNVWLLRRALNYEHMPKLLTRASAQNLVLNSVLTGLTVGIATGEPSRFLDPADRIYRLYLDTMRRDGSLPEETRRGASALKYSNMAISGLTLLAELSNLAGRSLYAYRAPNGDIHTAVGFLATALANENLIAGYAAENVTPTDAPAPGGRQSRAFMQDGMGWSAIYLARFPDSGTARMLVKVLPRMPRAMYDATLGAVAACIWH